MSVIGNAAASVLISMIPPGAYSSAMARARRNKINEPTGLFVDFVSSFVRKHHGK
jgi:hypothetical protein